MKHLAITLFLAAAVLSVSACSGNTDHSGASYAKTRTAGDAPGTVFKKRMYK